MTYYTREFIIRIISLIAVLICLLGGVVFWFNKIDTDIGESYIFSPEQKISQIKSMASIITDESLEFNVKNEIPCNERSHLILKIRAMEALKIDSKKAEDVLNKINSNLVYSLSCHQWLENIQYFKNIDFNSTFQAEIESKLSEKISWTSQIPCLFYRFNDKYKIMMGNPIRCAYHQKIENQYFSNEFINFDQIIKISKSYLSNLPEKQIQKMNDIDHLFTLDAKLQSLMDKWYKCFESRKCPDKSLYSNARQISVVILDAEKGDILSTLCWSGACDKGQVKNLNQLASLLVEAPPASTAKLLHAIALAKSNNIDALMLQRQIKTSGQTDGKVTKRNEWWERQSICDGLNFKSCNQPMLVNEIANLFKWNLNCNSSPVNCGRTSLIENGDWLNLSGMLGYIRTSKSSPKPSVMMSWTDYDAIRQGKKKTDGSVSYLNTALAVQSVIGAGDNRISALGLANLSFQIHTLSNKKNSRIPVLIRRMDLHEEYSKPPSQHLTDAAKVVLGGMRKVVEPAETGWVGHGTVSDSFQNTFGKPCLGECGVWAKTGTVSFQDPNFAGTTLFTGLVDFKLLNEWRFKDNKTPSSKIAIGVIALPVKGANPGHISSKLAMQIIKDISEMEEVK